MLANGGAITVFGTGFSALGPLTGTGTFSGVIGGTQQTLSYSVWSGSIVLAATPAAAPEPSQFAALAIGFLGLGTLTLKAKKRAV